jgi:hypothetical protein
MRYARDRYLHVLRLLLDAGIGFDEAHAIAREFRA